MNKIQINNSLPKVLGEFPIKVTEQMLYLYLPIKMADSMTWKIPDRLKQFNPLIERIFRYKRDEEYFDKYVYITAKHLLVHPGFWGNRGNYHLDGFLTNDINWVWCDANPTTYNSGEFVLTPDHSISLKEMEEQADYKNEVQYPENTLLELDNTVVHKVTPVTRYYMRTFVKFSMSTEKYNLVGNSHNYMFNYDWKMYDRDSVRNHPVYAELQNSDYVPDDVA